MGSIIIDGRRYYKAGMYTRKTRANRKAKKLRSQSNVASVRILPSGKFHSVYVRYIGGR